ncbi:restriction endonuclease [Allostreptomyces psammosilenae]|uniref:Restriction system protein n=1 Tax=Allostreptomyces psammosilenae TaxID=1892865 RepID=A0A852ZTA2_9ACTN|nr:restriction endonuclease [Allostreptomyces psammosilenae]NYI05646.1 restriction system protein [Allostreptomyces psammosilenae]
MSRRSHGLIATWAEVQRQQQRQREAQLRAQERQRREAERQLRAAERAAARSERERQAEYRRRREADALRRTEEIEARVEALRRVLASGCAAPAFSAAALYRPERVEPFAPGALAVPVPMPDPAAYQPVVQGGGWGFGAGRQAQAQAEARARFERDWAAAQAAEAQRLHQLETYRRQYQAWADGQLAAIREHNAGVERLAAALRRGEPEQVVEYFSAALYAAQGWPDDFPRQVSAAFDPAARQLVLNWELPGLAVVPQAASVRYMPSVDREKETRRPVAERRALYRDVLAQCVLLALRDVFAADQFGVLDSVALNGFVDGTDPATGRHSQTFLATVMARRADFDGLNLARVDPVDCLVEALRGQLSERPDRPAAVRPGRTPDQVGRSVVSHGGGEEPDLYQMDPIEFEELVAELFRAMGMQAVTTQRSGDGGVDVDALDPDPIRGGKIVVQVKRYRNTVPPTAVRDLYGTVQDTGANKGVLITTSSFGPGAHAFAAGEPLTLVSGGELVDLLHRHGLTGRLGEGSGDGRGSGRSGRRSGGSSGGGGAGAGGGSSAGGGARGGARSAGPDAGLDDAVDDPNTVDDLDDGVDDGLDETSVLGMSWSGRVALDVCALVCEGNRVVSEDHFVFYNNPQAPDGSVRTMPGSGPDRAAIWVRFDRLPARADRLVLVAAVDPEANPDADLSGFTDARIRLSDTSGALIDELAVSDGRPGETALVLGSFRRRADGDWRFVLGGKGYPQGLVALVEEYGIEVA